MKLVKFNSLPVVSKIIKAKNKIKNIYNFLNKVEFNTVGNTTYIKIPHNLVLSSNGNMLIYSTDGVLVTKHKKTHINPDITFEIKDDINDISKKALERRILLSKQSIFINALKHKKIHYYK